MSQNDSDLNICPKCGVRISNDFGVTLAFCTNCGQSISLFRATSGARGHIAQKSRTGFSLVTLVLLVVAGLLAGSFGVYFYMSRPSPRTSSIVSDAPDLPRTQPKTPTSVRAADISQIAFLDTSPGPLGLGDFTATSLLIAFGKNNVAHSLTKKKNYRDGKIISTSADEEKGAITEKQFKDLAQILIENNFDQQDDAIDSVSDGHIYYLIIKYADKEKSIRANNESKDVPEVAAILNAIKDLERQVGWKKAPTAQPPTN